MSGRAIDMAAVRARWQTIRGVFVDLDGTVYHGPELVPGADAALRRIAASGRRVLYVSNNASATLRSVVEKLRAFGLEVPDEAVITAVSLLAERLGQSPEARVLALCEEGARQEFEAAGARLLPRSLTDRSQWPTGLGGYTERPSPGHVAMQEAAAADIVAVGCHGDFGFHSVALALQALSNGALLMATDGDSTYPVPGGLLPGTGSLLAALEFAAGRRADFIAGKPHPPIAEAGAARLGLTSEVCGIVGDRLDSDIRLGRYLGGSALLLGGVTTEAEALTALAEGPDRPDAVFRDLSEFAEWLPPLA